MIVQAEEFVPDVEPIANDDAAFEDDPSRWDQLPVEDEPEPAATHDGNGDGASFGALLLQDERERQARRVALVARGINPDDFPPAEWPKLLRDGAPSTNHNGGPAYRPLSLVEMKSIEWLERPLWQRAAFHLVAGKKGSGKGTLLAGLAARASRGELFDRPMNVLIVASEDSDEIDVKPRIVAAGGDPERIYTWTGPLLLPRDIPKLEAAAREIGDVGLIVIDPVGNHLGGADTDKEGSVRDAIAPLNDLADVLGCIVVGVRHLAKNTDRGALVSVLGSTAWVDVPRAVLAVAADDEEDLVFHIGCVAGNRSARGNGCTFRIELVDVGLKEPVTRAVQLGPSTKNVETLLSEASERKGRAVKRDGCEDIILRELAEEPRPLDYLKAVCAAEIGASGETTYRAANSLKAKGRARPLNGGPGTPWLWRLSPSFLESVPEPVACETATESQKSMTLLPSHPPREPDSVTSYSTTHEQAHNEVTPDTTVEDLEW